MISKKLLTVCLISLISQFGLTQISGEQQRILKYWYYRERLKTQFVTEIDKREWAFKMKEQEQTSEMIRAYRDVGVAYGNGQPDSIEYNVNGWW